MALESNKADGWNIIGRSFWNIGHVYIRENNSALDMFLENIHPHSSCCIIGASGVDLIKSAFAQELNFSVIDFSKTMCDDLAREIKPKKCQMYLQDVILDDPLRFDQEFSYILTDQVINTFSRDTVPIFFKNISKMLKPGGELRTIIKVGFYDLDQLIIDQGQKRGTLNQFYNQQQNTINYAKAEEELSAVVKPHEGVPKEVLVNWYMNRGEESRFELDEIDHGLANQEISDGHFQLLEARPITSLTQAMYFRFQWHPGN